MKRRLSVSIRPDGTVIGEASGTPGPDCLDALGQLQALLQAQIVDSRPTEEWDMLPGQQTATTAQEEARQRLEGQA